jgi:hypothetical protein
MISIVMTVAVMAVTTKAATAKTEIPRRSLTTES